MDEAIETLKAVQTLLRFTARCYARALSLDFAIKGIMALSPEGRSNTTWDDVQNMIIAAREQSDQISRTQISQLEPLLESGRPWQPAVLAYVSALSKPE
jgi:hypothetical protein